MWKHFSSTPIFWYTELFFSEGEKERFEWYLLELWKLESKKFLIRRLVVSKIWKKKYFYAKKLLKVQLFQFHFKVQLYINIIILSDINKNWEH